MKKRFLLASICLLFGGAVYAMQSAFSQEKEKHFFMGDRVVKKKRIKQRMNVVKRSSAENPELRAKIKDLQKRWRKKRREAERPFWRERRRTRMEWEKDNKAERMRLLKPWSDKRRVAMKAWDTQNKAKKDELLGNLPVKEWSEAMRGARIAMRNGDEGECKRYLEKAEKIIKRIPSSAEKAKMTLAEKAEEEEIKK